tara:strand:- start:6 stop:806 length:801 start_codon:yes stop_codon:yes gene_type:complete
MGGSPVPTVLRPMTELASNKDGLGRDIRPSWLENDPRSETEKIHPWTAKTQGGELALNLAEQLDDMGYETSPENLLYLYRNYTGGPGTTVQRLFNVTSKVMNGEKVTRSDIPILRRFFGETYAKTFELRTNDRQILDRIEKDQATASSKLRRVADKYTDKLSKSDSPQERSRILQDMMIDPRAEESVVRRVETFLKDEAAGITATDKRVRTFSVAAKAQYFIERIEGMDRQGAARYLQEQINRNVLTPSVEKTMGSMQAFKSFFGK